MNDPLELTPLERAQAILSIEPIPADAKAEIDALYDEADADEKQYFPEIYEGLFVAESA